ncbi:MAG: GtrA family protein [Candidatus Woesearchaeota archaeon]|jgi:putative flippase GtrA|nr:GtrA family protein [Candidatus Woesearchaeota archaeon]
MKRFKDELKNLNIFNPVDWYFLFLKFRFVHFLLVGGTGVLINILFTAFFAEIVFGREEYFYAYLIGLFSNLVYNFILHTKFTFKTKDKHKRRFTYFIVYNLLMSALQAVIIKSIVDYIGVDYYLLVIVGVIGFFFTINFLVSKLILFKGS